MTLIVLIVGVLLAIAILSLIPKLPNTALRAITAVVAVVVLLVFIALGSVRYVGPNQVGIVKREALGPRLTGSNVIATNGEMGTQADVLPPGWHLWYWPVVYNVDIESLTVIEKGNVGLIEAIDGLPLAENQVFASEWPQDQVQDLLDATYFLTSGTGQKGQQVTVLTPGKYRLNTELFKVTTVPQTDVIAGTVAVLKSNFGDPPSVAVRAGEGETITLATEGEKGIRAEPVLPGTYPINTLAYQVSTVSTERRVAQYTKDARAGSETFGAITVKSQDAFSFPVDVRVVYHIKDVDAPKVVALLGGDNEKLQELLTSRVRAIFRDNAESVKALDYIQQRSTQATAAAKLLADAMERYGVTIESVDIGEVSDEETLGTLLATQRDREIALQEQETFKEQQRAAEQKKELTRTEQEAEEEKRLATARYQVQIAEQDKERRIIEAGAEAEAITIQAQAQADAYRLIADQIGKGNAALVEVLKIVGEQGISITPRVMVSGATEGQSAGQAETIALIGTMLDTMVEKQEEDDAIADRN